MKPNVAQWERVLRVLVGVFLLALAVIGPRTPWGLLGMIPLISGSTGFCPLYYALGIGASPRNHRAIHGH
jgi:hypothetical protein